MDEVILWSSHRELKMYQLYFKVKSPSQDQFIALAGMVRVENIIQRSQKQKTQDDMVFIIVWCEMWQGYECHYPSFW